MTQRLEYRRVAPDAVKALGALHTYVAQCGLGEDLIELVNLRVSQINGCAYCIDLHSRALQKGGVPAEKINLVLVWREAGSMYSSREQAALAWAETVTLVAQTSIPDADYEAAKLVFSEKELVDLTVAIGLMNTFNRLAIGFRAKPDSVKRIESAASLS